MPIETDSALENMSLESRICVLKALADASRAAVVNALLEQPHCVEELAARLRRAPSTISFHLRKLEEANLVSKTKNQYYLVYHLRQDILDTKLRDFITQPVSRDSEEMRRLKRDRDRVVAAFFRNGALKQLPKQWRKRRIVLEQFLALFDHGRAYEEHEVNERITTMFDDYCTIRRLLIDEGYMTRDGQTYLRVKLEHETMEESRSEIKRRYKETPKQAGIFLITNTANGKVMLGSSLNLHGPLNKHRFLLSLGNHWVKPLQEDWNRYGPDCFRFEVVDQVKMKDDPEFDVEKELGLLEELWIEKTKPTGELSYNKDLRIRE